MAFYLDGIKTGRPVFLSAFLAVATAAAGHAATVVNRQSEAVQIKIVGQGSDGARTVAPGQVLENVCPEPCIIRLNSRADSAYEVQPEDHISIENGVMYYDNARDHPQN